MVMPLSRSKSILSNTWACISLLVRRPVFSIIRSASVDLPWSMWAIIQKLRILLWSIVIAIFIDSSFFLSIIRYSSAALYFSFCGSVLEKYNIFFYSLQLSVSVLFLVFSHFPVKTSSKISARGSIAFLASSKVLVWAPTSINEERGRRWRL